MLAEEFITKSFLQRAICHWKISARKTGKKLHVLYIVWVVSVQVASHRVFDQQSAEKYKQGDEFMNTAVINLLSLQPFRCLQIMETVICLSEEKKL